MPLSNKKILLGVTGSIAAYKACDLVQNLKSQGAQVRVILTPQAAKFISPIIFESLTGYPAAVDVIQDNSIDPLSHINLARWADIFLIAPCTANTLGEAACGLTGSLVSAVFMTFTGKSYMAPAMHPDMFRSSAVVRNIEVLKNRGVMVMPAGIGPTACGEFGRGKMLDVDSITEYLKVVDISGSGFKAVQGKKALLVAGHSRENIDGIRYISNKSSGKTGFALGRALNAAGAEVTLVCGSLDVPVSNEYLLDKNRFIRVETTAEYFEAVMEHRKKFDCIILAAALADFIPTVPGKGKIKNSKSLQNLKLKPSVNVLNAVTDNKLSGQAIVGFALENAGNEDAALSKWRTQDVDILVINTPISKNPSEGFGKDRIRATVLSNRNKNPKSKLKLSSMTKYELAHKVLQSLNYHFTN